MLKKKSFVKLMNILKSQSEKHEGMATAFSAMYNFIPEREAIMSKTDAECVMLDLFGNTNGILEWLKEEMRDEYDYISWFTSECEYGTKPRILYITYNEKDKLTNMYLVDTPAMLFDIITDPFFGRKNTVSFENSCNMSAAFVHGHRGEQYHIAGTMKYHGKKEGIILNSNEDDVALIYTKRQNGRFVLKDEADDSNNFIEQLTNQKFADEEKTIRS